jgi:hypothetical protein
VDEVDAVALEVRMRSDVDEDVEVAGRAGTSTSMVCRVRTRPSPRHSAHAVPTTFPVPSHRRHGAAVTS